jgi:hypothetical protein
MRDVFILLKNEAGLAAKVGAWIASITIATTIPNKKIPNTNPLVRDGDDWIVL